MLVVQDEEGRTFGAHASTSWCNTEGGWVGNGRWHQWVPHNRDRKLGIKGTESDFLMAKLGEFTNQNLFYVKMSSCNPFYSPPLSSLVKFRCNTLLSKLSKVPADRPVIRGSNKKLLRSYMLPFQI